MRVKILKRSFAGAEFAPDVRVLKVGGQSSAGVEKLEFELPAEWQGLSVTLHVQWAGRHPGPHRCCWTTKTAWRWTRP